MRDKAGTELARIPYAVKGEAELALPGAVRLTQVSIHGKPAHSQLFLVRAGTETELGSPPVNLLVREDEPVQLRVAARGYEERLLTISFEEAAASPNISFELVPR